MLWKVLILTLVSILAFSGYQFIIGMDIDGHFFPYVGISAGFESFSVEFSAGFTYDQGIVFMPKFEIDFPIGDFRFGGAMSSIIVFPSPGFEKMLILAGVKGGYVFTDPLYIELSGYIYSILPVSAGERFGIVPFAALESRIPQTNNRM